MTDFIPFLWGVVLVVAFGWLVKSKILRTVVTETFLHPTHPSKIEKDEKGNVRVVHSGD